MPAPKKTSKTYTLGKVSDLHDLTLPSGSTCEARRPGVQGLIAAGLLDSFDDLTALVQTEHVGPKSIGARSKVTKADAEAAAAAMTADPAKLSDAFALIDRLTAYVVTQPTVWVDYQMKDEKDEAFAARSAAAHSMESVPVTAIADEDKMFLLQWAVGGSADLAAFREGLGVGLDDVATG